MTVGRTRPRFVFKTPSGGVGMAFDSHPDECPACHKAIVPDPLYAEASSGESPNLMEIVYRCPSAECGLMFLARFRWSRTGEGCGMRYETGPVKARRLSFPDEIRSLSEGYCKVYEQAAEAEQRGLLDVAGVGYGKALEFLVTDFALKHNPADEEKILKLRLVDRIRRYIKETNAALCADESRLLRNEETHYKETGTVDLDALKEVLSLTESWILVELRTKAVEARRAARDIRP